MLFFANQSVLHAKPSAPAEADPVPVGIPLLRLREVTALGPEGFKNTGLTRRNALGAGP